MRFPYDDDNYATELDSWSESDIEDDELLEQIYLDETQNTDSEKTTNTYYIGSIFQERNYDILGIAITPKTLFNYDIQFVKQYLYNYSGCQIINTEIEIIKLDILQDLTYACILKTHWLRLVQTHWRKTFAIRKEILEKRRKLDAIHYFELHGKYMDGLQYLPSIRGLMQTYN